MRSRSARPSDGYKALIKAFLVAVAVLLVADFAVTHSWPNGLTEPAAPARIHANADAKGGPSQSSAIYYWRGALMAPSAADATAVDRSALSLGRRGMVVAKVFAGSPAARAKLKAGDIVVWLDAFPVTTPRSLAFAVADHGGGPMVRLRVWRPSPRGAVPLSLLVPSDQS
jgi:S1-C subfamily serine protease